jgi:hypothetical protein
MAIPASGAVSFSDLRTEFVGGSSAISLGDLYRKAYANASVATTASRAVGDLTINASIPLSGQISANQFYSSAGARIHANTITGDSAVFNVGNNANTAGWNRSIPLVSYIDVASAGRAYSTSTGSYGFTDGGSLPTGSKTVLLNNGIIAGKGGAGGAGGAGSGTGGSGGGGGDPGGTGLQATAPMVITNNGTILGGGGGGAGSPGGQYNDGENNTNSGGGGGGGGGGVEAGPGGAAGPSSGFGGAPPYPGSAGSAGSSVSPWSGGGGGPGGPGRSAGSPGGSAGTASSGAAGPATSGAPTFITFVATGTRLGPVG